MTKYLLELLKKYGIDPNSLKRKIENIKNIYSDSELDKILIGESYFFRDREMWLALKEYLKRFRNRKIDFLSLGCSKGEEVYSFCFIAEELGLEYNAYGIDASIERIKQAREGIYDFWSIRKLTISELEKYFVRVNDKWKVKDTYRKKVAFETGNILELRIDDKFDIIMLRKVLIYFEPLSIEMVLNKVANILRKDGVLILGKGEYYQQLESFFEPLKFKNSIYWSKKRFSDISKKRSTHSKSSTIKIKRTKVADSENKKVKNFQPLSLEFVENLIENGKYEEALKAIDKLLEDNPISYIVWKYKAIAEMNLKKLDEAKNSLEKAVFLNPEDYELWYLDELLRK
jgi:chemotaxis protein methyltransferase CheR